MPMLLLGYPERGKWTMSRRYEGTIWPIIHHKFQGGILDSGLMWATANWVPPPHKRALDEGDEKGEIRRAFVERSAILAIPCRPRWSVIWETCAVESIPRRHWPLFRIRYGRYFVYCLLVSRELLTCP